MKILQVKHLVKCFGLKRVVDDVNFEVEEGECVGIVGPSGCGKSTLVKLIARLIDSDSGTIIFDGEDITHKKDLRGVYSKMQMVWQNPQDSFDPRKTLGWSIGEGMRNHHFKDINTKIKSLLAEVGLTADFFDKYPHEVSGGECQRAAIARAISLSPKLLICDEATSALDVNIQAQIIKLIKRLCTQRCIACLFITHNLTILPQIADKVLSLKKLPENQISL